MPSYLTQRAGRYHLRLRVPSDLQALLGYRELHHSLGTGDKRLAKRQAATLSRALQFLFSKIRQGELAHMTEAEIQAYIRDYVRSLLEKDEHARVMGRLSAKPDGEFPGWGGMKYMLRESLGESPKTTGTSETDNLIQQFGLTLQPDTYEYLKLHRELLKAVAKVWEIIEHRDEGDYDFEKGLFKALPALRAISPPVVAPLAPLAPSEPLEPKELLSKVLDRYYDRKVSHVAESSKKEFENHTRLFYTVVGDIPVESIDHGVCRNFVDILHKIPANWKKKKKYQDKGIKQLLEMTIPTGDRLVTRTISNIVTNVGTFLNWAVNQGYIAQNYMKGKGPKSVKASTSTKSPYTEKDMAALFNSREYSEDLFDKPYKFWLPLLGLFTGARLEELCQLHLDDLKQIDGVLCLDINDDGDKQLKNDSSHRLIPLHPVLTRDLKFHKWVDSLRGGSRTRVFSELTKRYNAKLGHTVSKWYGKFRQTCGVDKDFHTLRHTFADTCKQQNLGETKVMEVLGHTVKGMSYGHYATSYNPKILYDDVVKNVRFPVDLGHLAKSKYCGK